MYLGDIHLLMFVNLNINDLLLRATVLVNCPVSLSSSSSESRELASLPAGPLQLWDLSPIVRHLDDRVGGGELGAGSQKTASVLTVPYACKVALAPAVVSGDWQ